MIAIVIRDDVYCSKPCDVMGVKLTVSKLSWRANRTLIGVLLSPDSVIALILAIYGWDLVVVVFFLE